MRSNFPLIFCYLASYNYLNSISYDLLRRTAFLSPPWVMNTLYSTRPNIETHILQMRAGDHESVRDKYKRRRTATKLVVGHCVIVVQR